ncbi:MAG TPA: 2-oxoacid:acceptor oxidoreductase family protein [Phycisphaerae bacterium]|nr:2-oxoacid:acceptor oxidoreductase family protein [Phycisphaerae bacterium]
MLEETILAGFGGQGVLMMGKLLAQAAMEEGTSATWLPSYGPEMRGGTANCIVVLSDDEIGSPVSEKYDTVVAMNQPSLQKFESKVRPGGTLLINKSIVPIKTSRNDVNTYYVEANDIAESECGTNRSANVVMLGALQSVRQKLKPDSIEKAIAHAFESKGQNVIDANLKAFAAGMNAIDARETATP